jgi:hypothetical protein
LNKLFLLSECSANFPGWWQEFLISSQGRVQLIISASLIIDQMEEKCSKADLNISESSCLCIKQRTSEEDS